MRWVSWVPFGAVGLHILEEFVWPGGFLAWYHTYRPQVAASLTPRFVVTVNSLLLGFAALAGALGPTAQGVAVWLTVAAITSINGVWHGQATLRGRRYSPGVITGVLLYLPMAIGGYVYFIHSGQASVANAAVAGGLGASYWIYSEGRKMLRARAPAQHL